VQNGGQKNSGSSMATNDSSNATAAVGSFMLKALAEENYDKTEHPE